MAVVTKADIKEMARKEDTMGGVRHDNKMVDVHLLLLLY